MQRPAKALTHRRVLKIALPIVLANATVPILGAVDTGVVGQINSAVPIGAVGIGAIILSAIYWIFGFLRMGTTGLTAQAHGAGQQDEVSALLLRVLLIGLAAGLGLILLQRPVMWAAFSLSPASPAVESLARDYVSIRIYSAPAAIALLGLTGWLIALERTRAVLVLQLWMNGLNILLDLWFVLGLGWGVSGVALATVLSEGSGLVLGLVLCRHGLATGMWRKPALVLDPVRLRRMLGVNTDIMVRSVLLQIAFLSFLFLGAGLGDVTLAANQVLMQFLNITAFALDGFAFAAESLVGQAMGARDIISLRNAVRLSSLWSLGVIILLSIGFLLFGGWLIALMTRAPDVREMAEAYLVWIVVAPLIGVASWMLDGVFIGATRTRDMRIAMLVSTLIYGASVAILLPLFGNHGLWAALMVLFIARALTLLQRYPALEHAARRGPGGAADQAG